MHVTEAKAVKMQLEQHKKALNDMFKALRKEGLSYRKGLVSKDIYNCRSVFSLPIGHFLSNVLDSNCYSENCRMFFESVVETKCLQSFLGKPSKQLNSSQLSRIQGFTAHLLRLVCEEKIILGTVPEKLFELNHIVGKFGLAVESGGEVFSTAAFKEHKCTLYICFEECIDAISELQVLLESKPNTVDFSLTPLNPNQTCIDLFSKGDSLQALKQLQEYVQQMKALYSQFLTEQWKCRSMEEPFVTKKELRKLAEGYRIVKDFAETLCGLGIHESNPLYGYLTSLSMKLQQKELIVSIWIGKTNETSTAPPSHVVEELYINQLAKTLQPLMMGIQKVMQFIDQNKTKGDDPVSVLIIHEAVTKNLEKIGLLEVVEQSKDLLNMFVEYRCSSCLISMSSAYYLLQQYSIFVTKVLSDGLIFHSHMCKLFTTILKLFCTLTNKGFHSDVSDGNDKESTESADVTEAGGFDDGSTAEDSKNVDPTDVNTEGSNLAENKEEKSQGGKDDENVLENNENFEGALETVEDGDDSKSDEGSQSDYSEEMGSVEENQDSHLDEHMWAPDEDDTANMNEKPDDDIEQGQGTAMDDEQKIVAKDEENTRKGEEDVDMNDKNCELEEEPPHSDEENGTDLMGEPLEDSSVDNGIDDANIGSDSDIGDVGDSEHDVDDNDEGGEECGLENDVEDNDDNLDDKEKEDMANDLAAQCQGESKTNMPESISSSRGLQDAKEDSKDALNTNGMGACEKQEDNETEDADNSVNEPTSDNTEQKPQSSQGQPLGRNTADKRPREASMPESTQRLTNEHHTSANIDEMEASVKRPKLTQDTTKPVEEEASNSSEYVHKPDGSASTWDVADQGQELQKNPDDDETSIEIDKIPDTDNPKVLKQSTEETVSYFSNHTPFSNDISADIEALKQMRQKIQARTEPFQTQDQHQLAVDLWVKYEALVLSLSNSLYEELRIILQPTLAAHLRGDFRSGKKLNMRRIVPYIASGFRNDRIWLRRVKPSRRDYEILISVDDSSSMAENNCVEMAYKSIAMISGALQRLDCGQLGVFKFGEDTEILHPFNQAFTSANGAMVLQRMTFTQTRTNFVKMMQTAAMMFSEKDPKHHVDIKQLLIILSDGRGVFSEGETAMELSTRYMNQMGILTVFIIMDCSAQDSVVNIQVPIFLPGQAPQIKKYLETFPFQFYVVLKDVASLPTVLGQALHQWFEYINKF
eukprot:Em0016g534a